MTNHSQQIVQKLWNYCNVLRDDGMSYGDYVEQLTYLLFLKMADERTRPALGSRRVRHALQLQEPPHPQAHLGRQDANRPLARLRLR